MGKNSFSLFETILSITLLSVVIGGFLKSSYYDNKNLELYQFLNKLENQFNTNNYENMKKSKTNIQIIINKEKIKNVNVNKYVFKNEHINIYKYEK